MSTDKNNSDDYFGPTAYEELSAIDTAEQTIRPIVYICSRFSGDVEKNVRAAQRFCRFAVDKGVIPIAPHLLFPQYLDDDNPAERLLGLIFGNALMSKCAEVWVFGDTISAGMAAEIKRAEWKRYRLRYFNDDCEEKKMFAISEGTRLVGGREVSTYTREIFSCNVLEVEAGTNGYQGGDTGHGSRTYFRIQDLGSTDIEVHALGRFGDEGFEVSLGGDCELETILTALRFITQVLEDGAKEVQD